MNLEKLVRKNIYNLKPYSCARDEFKGEASIYLDANESPYNQSYNRYPDPLQEKLKELISKIKKIKPSMIMLGNGSDECIDLIFRIFCEPAIDNVTAIEPTYGIYKVFADINNVEYRKVLLDKNFQFNAEQLLEATNENTKVIFLCSPNNPTGNLLDSFEIQKAIENFSGIVVIDEAYVDFSSEPSWLNKLDNYPNLIVLHTFSKAWGLASLRCGMAFASKEIIGYFNKVKYPYNISTLIQKTISNQLHSGNERKNQWVKEILNEREHLSATLQTLPIIEKVYPSDSNFLLVKVKNANGIYKNLVDKGIIVRNRHSVSLCGNCLRITVGKIEENDKLIDCLKMLNL